MLEHLLLPCIVTVAAIALSAILFKGFLKKRAGQTAVEGSADNDSATESRTCTTPQVGETATSSRRDYEVFLSFRGPDTRSGFTDYLYTSLTDAGIRTFKDDKDLHIGEEFAPELLEAINQSRISIPIFSKGYASSVWCLKELVQMVKHQKNKRQKIMPIFYDVTPSEVRRQTGSFKNAFVSLKRKRRYDEKTIAEWKDALTAVTDIKGWDLQSMPNRQEGQFVKTITEKVFNELKKAYLVVSNCLVNVDNHVDAIMELIGPHTSETRIIGIYGMGGIGKTTTAKIIYNQLVEKFDCCCFVPDIREKSECEGIEFLQNQLISDILKYKGTDIRNIDDGINTIKERLSNKRVLLLLDDVHEKKHMDALAGERDWFGKGSKLIITTRNKEVLDVLGVDSCYELSGMDHDQSLQLFSKHAFRRDHPLDEYINQSERAIKIAGSLPLALEVMGSLLAGIDKKKWDSKLAKWESDAPKSVRSKLKISYDELEDKEKQIFLDIACLLIGYEKDIMVHFWISEFYPEDAIDVLENMSLIKIREDNKVWMHDQLRDLGRHIVCQETNINKQIRVWDREKALDLLKSPKTKKKVEALRLRLDHQHRFTYKDFKSLPRLRFLEVDDSEQTFCVEKMLLQHKGPSNVLPTNVLNSNLLPQLRWLSWHNIHPTFEIANFSIENLTILDLSRSEITHDWKGWSHMKVIKNLKVLNLAHCRRLKTTPNFFAHLNLEHLILSSCESLIEIDGSICELKRLVFLDVSACWNLQRLPEMVGNLDLLTKLDISHTSIEEVPDSIGMLKNLKVMKMQNDVQNKMHNDAYLGKVKGMEITDRYNHVWHVHTIIGYRIYGDLRMDILGWSGVHALPRFPESLTELELEELRVDAFPDLSYLANLKVLHLSFGPPNCDGKSYGLLEESIPRWIGNLSKLESLELRFYKETASSTDLSLPPHPHRLPRLPSNLSSLLLYGCDLLCSMDLSNLRKLLPLNILFYHSLCRSIKIAQFSVENLIILDLSRSEITHEWMGWSHMKVIKNLKVLNLTYCQRLKRTPNFSALSNLERLILSSCESLIGIDRSIGQLKSLIFLDVSHCWNLQRLPETVGNMDSLTELDISDTAIGELPLLALTELDISDTAIEELPLLAKLNISHTTIEELPSLTKFDISHTTIEEVPNSIEMLKNLKVMKMQNKIGERIRNSYLKSGIRNAYLKSGICNQVSIGYHYNYIKDIDVTIGDRIYGYESPRKWGMGWPGVHALPRLPESLIELKLEELRADTFPDLSSLANLKVLHLGLGPPNCDGKYNGLLEEPIPRWIGNLSQLESLKLRFLKETASSIDLSLPLHLRRLPRLPSNLSSLHLSGCDSLCSMDLSNLRKLSSLEIWDCAVAEIEGLGCLENLRYLHLEFVEQLAVLPDLNKLNKLRRLQVWGCGNLVEIQGELPQSLEKLRIQGCESLQKLLDLSSLKRLREVTIRGCGKLDVEEISRLCWEKSVEFMGEDNE